jgi:membrane protease YdiL (CAAX protease family)
MNTRANILAVPVFLILTPLLGVAFSLFLPFPIEVIVLLVALIPALLAGLLAAMTGGRKGLGALLKKPFQWRISFKWYAIALALPLGIHLSTGLLALLFGWIPSIQIRPGSPQTAVIGVAILIWAVLEELGWRGFALPRLLARRSALLSAVLVGISWGVFHLGLGAIEARPLMPTFLAPFAASIILTWLFVQSRGNLLMIILCHFGLNFFSMFLHGLSLEQSIWLQASASLLVALILIIGFGPGLKRDRNMQPVALQL